MSIHELTYEYLQFDIYQVGGQDYGTRQRIRVVVVRRRHRLVKTAWRAGYSGLACIIAICWDIQFSPVDTRTLRSRHHVTDRGRLIFDRQQEGRTKTGRAAIGTLSYRTEHLVSAYFEALGAELLPDALLFRNRAGDPYREATLADDFAAVITRRTPNSCDISRRHEIGRRSFSNSGA